MTRVGRAREGRLGKAVGAARRRWAKLGDTGMATAEYALVTLAAVGFAGLLLTIVRSDAVRSALQGIILRALG